jgi:hypothetical protein
MNVTEICQKNEISVSTRSIQPARNELTKTAREKCPCNASLNRGRGDFSRPSGREAKASPTQPTENELTKKEGRKVPLTLRV